MTDWLEHYTVQTGHSRRSRRDEVVAGVLEVLAPIVAAGGGVIGPDGLAVSITCTEGAAVYTLSYRDIPVASAMLCWDGAANAEAWEAITHGVTAVGAGPDSLPWLAAVVHDTAALAPMEVVTMCGDAERCIAWAILEGLSGRG